MKKLWAKLIGLGALAFLLMPGIASASGGPVAPMVIVADSRQLDGLMAWWANLYNESHVYFMIMSVILIPVIGVLFGLMADLVMGHMGLDLKSRDLAEH